MKAKQEPPHPHRVEYRWPSDREQGFEKVAFVYDRNGRLSGIDFTPLKIPRRGVPKSER
ncbi:MAG TPA: hypothetical protein VEK11_12150 [Thermoanaerobaculia bacterium]|jgi:hypothetical protein|nr:hypothetical protein [Thermoanaerobaculia bacterium]